MWPRLTFLILVSGCTVGSSTPGEVPDASVARPDSRPTSDDARPVDARVLDAPVVDDAPFSSDADFGDCTVNGFAGACESTSVCSGGNVSVPGFCPGPADIQCCVPSAALAVPDAAPRVDSLPRPDAGIIAGDPCPSDMAPVGAACMDLYEAPNQAGALPLVMYDFVEADAWCGAQGKRLCFDDEWQTACEGPDDWAYPYGPTRVAGECNDDKVWRVYDQSKLNGWPTTVSTPDVESLDDLFAAASAASTAGATAAQHVQSLYQGDPSGSDTDCVGAYGVYDLQGNTEEWTRRRDGGTAEFHGNLKGRYWAESRTCQSGVTTHGDGFRFYEIGFRCCLDPQQNRR